MDTISNSIKNLPTLKVLSCGQTMKILEVTGMRGMTMPLHYCTGEAVVVVEKGKSVLHIAQSDHPMGVGDSFVIPCDVPHQLELLDDFKAKVIMPLMAEIKFGEPTGAQSNS